MLSNIWTTGAWWILTGLSFWFCLHKRFCIQTLYFLFRDHGVLRVSWKFAVDLLTASTSGWGRGRESERSERAVELSKKKRKEIRLCIFLRYKYKSLSIFSVYTFHFFHRNCNTWWSNVVSVMFEIQNAVWFSSRRGRVYACNFSQFGLKIWWGPRQPARGGGGGGGGGGGPVNPPVPPPPPPPICQSYFTISFT